MRTLERVRYTTGAMTLAEYLAAEGHGSLTRLQQKTGVAYSTLHSIAKGTSIPRPATAKAIEEATDHRVRAATLLGLAAA